jgi:hypothetical protein
VERQQRQGTGRATPRPGEARAGAWSRGGRPQTRGRPGERERKRERERKAEKHKRVSGMKGKHAELFGTADQPKTKLETHSPRCLASLIVFHRLFFVASQSSQHPTSPPSTKPEHRDALFCENTRGDPPTSPPPHLPHSHSLLSSLLLPHARTHAYTHNHAQANALTHEN